MALDVKRVAAAPLARFTGHCWRHLGPRHDPLSGVGELRRFGARQAIGIEGLLPRKLYRYDLALDRILDLTSGEVRAQGGLGLDVLTGPDWTACQELGNTVHSLGAQGISSPSATGVGDILAVFVQQVGLGRLVPQLTEKWHSARQLDG